MTGNETFKHYTDPGHGWIAVKRAFLTELGIDQQISTFSFQKGGTAYLEEDRDASIFVAAYQAKFGHAPATIEKYSNNTPIRSYPCYKNWV